MTIKGQNSKAALLQRARGETIDNTDELAAVAIVTADLTIRRDQAILARDARLAAIKEEFAMEIEDLESTIETNTRRLRGWAIANRAEFGEKQTYTVAGHELAFRKSPGQVAFHPGHKEADALEKIMGMDDVTAEKLTTIKITLDKKAAIKMWHGGGEETLRAAGIEVIAPEDFTFRPDREAVQSAPVKIKG
jgi:phage host-nuclease inhibitor protein Gam